MSVSAVSTPHDWAGRRALGHVLLGQFDAIVGAGEFERVRASRSRPLALDVVDGKLRHPSYKGPRDDGDRGDIRHWMIRTRSLAGDWGLLARAFFGERGAAAFAGRWTQTTTSTQDGSLLPAGFYAMPSM
jgi:hypothetical protein